MILKKKGNITIHDIAGLAGVSPTTVSAYLNGRAKEYNLAQKTCERIQQIVDEQNYRPNFHARAMLEQKTHLVGVIITNIASSFWNYILQGINRELATRNFYMLLAETGNVPENERKAFNYMDNISVDGYIYAPVMDGNLPALQHSARQLRGKPIVSIMHPAPGIPSIFTDHTAGGYLAGETLSKAGHRRIAYLGKISRKRDQRDDERYNGMCNCLNPQGIEVPAFDDIESFLPHAREFTAAFCFRDEMAARLILSLQDMQIRIPDDISVIGYSFQPDIHEFVRPQLTTVMEYKEKIGQLAARQLLELIGNPEFTPESLETKLPPYLVEGQSVRQI